MKERSVGESEEALFLGGEERRPGACFYERSKKRKNLSTAVDLIMPLGVRRCGADTLDKTGDSCLRLIGYPSVPVVGGSASAAHWKLYEARRR